MMQGHNNQKEIPDGLYDELGLRVYQRYYVKNKIKRIYEKYGFIPAISPTIEFSETFKGHHGAGESLQFQLTDKMGESLVLRYDLTVPMARNVRSLHLDGIFKRYQIASSFRDDSVDLGHLREFTQCDADITGSDSAIIDTEIIIIIDEIINTLKIPNIEISLNHRGILYGIAIESEIHDKRKIYDMQCAIDETDNITTGNIYTLENNLLKNGFTNTQINNICKNILEIYEENAFDSMERLMLKYKKNINIHSALERLKEIISLLPSSVLNNLKLDPTLARGANYYTGFIIEAAAKKSDIGAIIGGGRYDELISTITSKQEHSCPAAGFSFGLERVMILLEKNKLLPDHDTSTSSETILLARHPGVSNNQFIKFSSKLRKKFKVYTYYDPIKTSKDINIHTFGLEFKRCIILKASGETCTVLL